MMSLRAALTVVGVALAVVSTGCAASTEQTGSVPESAALAPADAVAFVILVTDRSSEQWEKADRLLSLFPEARAEVLEGVRGELAQEDLTWEDDVAPALGDELVVVVTASRKPVVLLQPESAEALSALIAESDGTVVEGSVSDWTALAETQADLDAYNAAVGRATLDGVDSFQDAMTELPAEALLRGWVNVNALASDFASALEQSGVQGELGVDWLAAAVTAEDDGVHLSVGVRTPDGSGSSYEPELLERVPADAVAALSFGGTQGVLDRIEGAVDVDEISSVLEGTVGVSLDGVLDALSGEGLLYVREGGAEVPEVTLVLAPPDTAKAFDNVDRIARTFARQAGQEVRTRTEGTLTVHELQAEGVALMYARLDDAVIVTTGPTGIADFLGDGAKLTDAEAFTTAADRVELGERTRGLAYVDIDGLIPLVESLAGPDALPAEARDVLGALDSFILQASGDGPTTTLSGFLRVTR
jgi:Protein of unknown function (DUF3352)